VVEKFHAARHNTAIMSAMGHPGLEKLVAKEEEDKRKRKARLKVRTRKKCYGALRYPYRLAFPHSLIHPESQDLTTVNPGGDGEVRWRQLYGRRSRGI
jgi:hypothetical protein